MNGSDDEVLQTVHGSLGVITLNRPKALNALSLGMVRKITAALASFETDPAVHAIAIEGAGDRAFCAGGDVRALVTGSPDEAASLRRGFFAEEYRLNYRIHACRKPLIALMDGITMGGGCGLSMHARYRISTERTMLAMPETVLGFFPDVGATWFLNRLPGELGVYLGLTGARLRAADLLHFGMATHHVASGGVSMVVDGLGAASKLDAAAIEAVLAIHAAEPEAAAEMTPRAAEIDALFGAATIAGIVQSLADASAPWAIQARLSIAKAAPVSLAVTLAQLRRGRGRSIEAVLETEYRLAVRMTDRPDFREGVRAILIDKDQAPAWCPSCIEAVEPALIASLFQPLDRLEAELDLT